MSIMLVPSFTFVRHESVPAARSDAEFERRWADWNARGVARERAVRHRWFTAVISAGVLGLGVLMAYGVLFA